MEIDTNGIATIRSIVVARSVVDASHVEGDRWNVWLYHGEVWHPPFLNAVFVRPNRQCKWRRVTFNDGTPLSVHEVMAT